MAARTTIVGVMITTSSMSSTVATSEPIQCRPLRHHSHRAIRSTWSAEGRVPPRSTRPAHIAHLAPHVSQRRGDTVAAACNTRSEGSGEQRCPRGPDPRLLPAARDQEAVELDVTGEAVDEPDHAREGDLEE